MKWISYLAAGVLLVAVGCHSPSLKTPMSGVNLAEQTSWVTTYKKAREIQSKDPKTSCRLFSDLEKEEKFPARMMAGLRKLEVCEDPQTTAVPHDELPEWLKDIALDINLKQVAKAGDKVGEIELALEKSKQNLPQKEKIKWVQLAITRAQETEQSDRLEELKQRLYKIAPRFNPNPKAKEYPAVAADFRLARQFDKAREYYEKILAGAFTLEEKIGALKGIRISYKNARQSDAHIEASLRMVDYLRKALKSHPRSSVLNQAYYESEIFYGRALWTAHRAKECREVFDRLEKKMHGRVSLAELYWLKARLVEEDKDYDGVANYLALSLKQRTRDSELRDKVLWYSAWNERRRGNLEAASQLLADLVDKTSTDFTRVRAMFWLGKTQSENKHEDDAKATFEKLVELDPVGYYGLLAHRNLGQAISFKPAVAPIAFDPKLPLDNVMAEWLAVLEEKDALTALLDESSRKYRKQEDQTDDGWVTVFQYYAKGGLYMKLYESMSSLSPERRKSLLETHPDLLFPQPWVNEVKTAALQFGVEEELIYAIIRQESAFDARARSLADAFGLMQVLPEVAENLSKQNNIPYTAMEDLYDPKTNVTIGAAHIKELLSRHRGQFILAVASYNANENAIKNWMRTRFRGDSLEFIEEIPYEETRTYVRLVMRNLIFYSLLKSKSASIEFPNWVLKLEDAS